MSYVNNNLMSGETIIYKANIHWFIFLPGIILAVLGPLMLAGDKQGEGIGANRGEPSVFRCHFIV